MFVFTTTPQLLVANPNQRHMPRFHTSFSLQTCLTEQGTNNKLPSRFNCLFEFAGGLVCRYDLRELPGHKLKVNSACLWEGGVITLGVVPKTYFRSWIVGNVDVCNWGTLLWVATFSLWTINQLFNQVWWRHDTSCMFFWFTQLDIKFCVSAFCDAFSNIFLQVWRCLPAEDHICQRWSAVGTSYVAPHGPPQMHWWIHIYNHWWLHDVYVYITYIYIHVIIYHINISSCQFLCIQILVLFWYRYSINSRSEMKCKHLLDS